MAKRKKLPSGFTDRKDGTLQYRFTVDGGRVSVYGSTVQECKEKELEARERAKQKMATRNRNITLDAYNDLWMESRKGTVKGSTLYANKRRYNSIKKSLGSMKVVDIERRDVLELQKHLAGELTTQGANIAIAQLRTVLQAAVNERIISWNPADGIKRLKRTEPKAAATIHRALSDQETKDFFQYAADSWYCNFFQMLISTGMRSGEAAALSWGDIDRKKNVIHITKTVTRTSDKEYVIEKSTKTRTSTRDIPLTADVAKILDCQKEMQKALNGSKVTAIDQRIFTTMDGKGLIKTTTLCPVIRGICRNATDGGHKIERFAAHAFRDTYATRAIESGMQPNTLKELLGHSSLAMTMDLYAHVMPETKQAEAEKVRIAF